jgi:hypothetical protein
MQSLINIIIMIFDVHGSVHLGNVYVQLKVQLDVHVFIRGVSKTFGEWNHKTKQKIQTN